MPKKSNSKEPRWPNGGPKFLEDEFKKGNLDPDATDDEIADVYATYKSGEVVNPFNQIGAVMVLLDKFKAYYKKIAKPHQNEARYATGGGEDEDEPTGAGGAAGAGAPDPIGLTSGSIANSNTVDGKRCIYVTGEYQQGFSDGTVEQKVYVLVAVPSGYHPIVEGKDTWYELKEKGSKLALTLNLGIDGNGFDSQLLKHDYFEGAYKNTLGGPHSATIAFNNAISDLGDDSEKQPEIFIISLPVTCSEVVPIIGNKDGHNHEPIVSRMVGACHLSEISNLILYHSSL